MSGGSTGSDSGSFHTPLYYHETEDLAAALNLKSGELVHAYVESVLPGEESKLLLNLKGRQVVAQSKPRVEAGDSLVVKVVSLAHPIELKIFTPEEAESELNEKELADIVKSMGLNPTEKINKLAREFLKKDIHLDAGLLEKAGNHWPNLTGPDGQLHSGRLDALSFLYSRKLPAKEVLLKSLGNMPNSAGAAAWQPLADNASFSPVSGEFDLRKQLLSLGIDLVRQLTRYPHSAASTLHARLLKKNQDKSEGSGGAKQLLALLLALGLANSQPQEEFNLLLPFVDSGQLRQLQLLVRPGEIPSGWSEPNWKSRLFVSLSKFGKLEVKVRKTKNKVGVLFINSDPGVLSDLRARADRLAEIFETAGYRIEVSFGQGEPSTPPDPLANTKTASTGLKFEGMDFIA